MEIVLHQVYALDAPLVAKWSWKTGKFRINKMFIYVLNFFLIYFPADNLIDFH